jgi:hypothetical protein
MNDIPTSLSGEQQIGLSGKKQGMRNICKLLRFLKTERVGT